MDRFDEIYDNQFKSKKPMPYEEENKDGKKQILEDKNKFIFKFLSSKKTLYFLIALVISFAFSAYDTLSGWFDGSAMGMFDFINDIALLIFAMLLPIAVNKIYQGAKHHYRNDVVIGLNIARTYLLILRVLLIIVTVALGILFLFALSYMTGWLFLLMLFLVIVIIIEFIMVKIFKEYVEELRGTVQKFNILIPSAKKIITFLTVMLVILLVVDIAVIVGMEYLVNNLGLIMAELDFTAAQITQLQAGLSDILIYAYISLAIGIATQVYILYYFRSYNKEVLPYNVTLRKEVSEYKEYVYKEQVENENENIKMNWGD